jgi:hypothetical protein
VSADAAEMRARLVKANKLVDFLVRSKLTGDDVRALVEAQSPTLDEVVRVTGVRAPSAATWETVAVLLDERRRLVEWARTQVPSDPFSVFDR